MSQKDQEFEENLPLELKLRVLQAELERLQSDFYWLEKRKEEVAEQIRDYQRRLSSNRRRRVLRRVK
ncbi:MAG: hypothetical protein ACE5JX_21470 [Acidobacteriota bacterium]